MNSNNNNSIYLSYDDRSDRVSWRGRRSISAMETLDKYISVESVSADLVNRISVVRVSVNGVSLLIGSLLIRLVS